MKGKMMKEEAMVDVIGDVHGRASALQELVGRLGYRKESGLWRNPAGRKALFIGDLVDRGEDVPGVLSMVKAMTDAGEATVLLGNHEFNLLCWYTSDGNGGYLRARTDRNAELLLKSTEYLDADGDAREMYLRWFSELPIRLEFGGARFVHAYWGERELKVIGNQNNLRALGWGNPDFRRTSAGEAVEMLIKGPEIRLPDGFNTIDRQGSKRKKARVAWWKDGRSVSMRDLILPYTAHLPEEFFPDSALGVYEPYSPLAPPVFIGHYGFRTFPGLVAANIACVDYQGEDKLGIGAYRWNGELELREENFVLMKS